MIEKFISTQFAKIPWDSIYDIGLILGQIAATLYLIAHSFSFISELINGGDGFWEIVDIAWCFAFFSLCKTVRQIKQSNQSHENRTG